MVHLSQLINKYRYIIIFKVINFTNFPSLASGGLPVVVAAGLLSVGHGLLVVLASLTAEQRLQGTRASGALALGL